MDFRKIDKKIVLLCEEAEKIVAVQVATKKRIAAYEKANEELITKLYAAFYNAATEEEREEVKLRIEKLLGKEG